MPLFKSSRKSVGSKPKRQSMPSLSTGKEQIKPQDYLAALEESESFSVDKRRSSKRSSIRASIRNSILAPGRDSISSSSSHSAFSTMSEDEVGKMEPQEILVVLEELGNNGLADTEAYKVMSKALKDFSEEDEDDGDFDICLDDVISNAVSR